MDGWRCDAASLACLLRLMRFEESASSFEWSACLLYDSSQDFTIGMLTIHFNYTPFPFLLDSLASSFQHDALHFPKLKDSQLQANGQISKNSFFSTLCKELKYQLCSLALLHDLLLRVAARQWK